LAWTAEMPFPTVRQNGFPAGRDAPESRFGWFEKRLLHTFASFSVVAATFCLVPGLPPCHAQMIQDLPANATGEPLMPVSSTGTTTDLKAPEYDIKAFARVQEGDLEEGKPFLYTVTLSWEGNQGWYSLKDPEVVWPKGIRQLDVGGQSQSSAGVSGPVGSKSYIYELVAEKAGKYDMPTIRLEVTAPGVETPVTAEAMGTVVDVKPRRVSASLKIQTALVENWFVLLGVTLLVIAGSVVYLVQRRRRKPVLEEPDLWAPVEEELKKAEALRLAGNDREYYGKLEKVMANAIGLVTGRECRQLSQLPDSLDLPEEIEDELNFLVKDLSDRKYRPDRPRPEEKDRALRQARLVLRSLKEIYERRGNTA